MTLRRPGLEGEGERVLLPGRAEEDDAGILEAVPQGELRHRCRRQGRVAPEERPVLFQARVPEGAAAVGHRLRFRIAQAGGDAVEEVRVALKRPARKEATDFLARRSRVSGPSHTSPEVEGILAIREQGVGDVRLPLPVGPELPHALARRVLPGVGEVHEPGRGEDPVLDPLVVIAVGGEELVRPVVMGVGGGRPSFGVRGFAHQCQRGHGQPRRRDEVVVLRELEPLALRPGRVVRIHEPRVALERRPDMTPLASGQLRIEEVVGPADRVEQMPGGEVDVRLACTCSPTARSRRRPASTSSPRPGGSGLCSTAQARLTPGDGVGHVVLRAALLRPGAGGGSRPEAGREASTFCQSSRCVVRARRRRSSSPREVTKTRGWTPTRSGLRWTGRASRSAKAGIPSRASAGEAASARATKTRSMTDVTRPADLMRTTSRAGCGPRAGTRPRGRAGRARPRR
jgi:hypothetical protein